MNSDIGDLVSKGTMCYVTKHYQQQAQKGKLATVKIFQDRRLSLSHIGSDEGLKLQTSVISRWITNFIDLVVDNLYYLLGMTDVYLISRHGNRWGPPLVSGNGPPQGVRSDVKMSIKVAS